MTEVKIGQLARAAGMRVSAIRYYEAQGLLAKPKTTESGYRDYDAEDLDRLNLINAAKMQRYPLRLIRVALDALENRIEPCPEIAEIVRGRLDAIESEIADLKRLHADLKGRLASWEAGTLASGGCICPLINPPNNIKE